jgi:NADH:ubiquinone oxidoreductase subunit 3 (subunit A)
MLSLTQYLPILIFMFLAVGLSVFLLCVSFLRSKRKPYKDKNDPYECGFDAFSPKTDNARQRFDVQFYLVAILFVIFDLEIAFLFPWSITLSKTGVFGFWSMVAFLTVLAVGFIYEWRKGALDWQ